jgi:hypothetical protein
MKNLIKILFVILLFLCLFEIPYGFYQLFQLISFFGFSYLTYITFEDNEVKNILVLLVDKQLK